MKRRELLATAGSALAVATAGCSGGGYPWQSDGNGEPGTDDSVPSFGLGPSDAEIVSTFRAGLEEADVEAPVLSVGDHSRSIFVVHYVDGDTEAELRPTIETVSDVYVAGIEDGWDDVTYLHCHADHPDDGFVTAYKVRREWAEDHLAGTLPREELTDAILDDAHPSIEPSESASEPEAEPE